MINLLKISPLLLPHTLQLGVFSLHLISKLLAHLRQLFFHGLGLRRLCGEQICFMLMVGVYISFLLVSRNVIEELVAVWERLSELGHLVLGKFRKN